MSLVLCHNESLSHQYRQNSLPATFYDDISQVIKIFRKQLTLFIKLSSNFFQQREMFVEMTKKKQEGLDLVKAYEEIILDENMYTIVQRFLGRIKEIVQLTNNISNGVPGIVIFISNGIKKIEMTVHKNIGLMTLHILFSDILNLLPSYFTSKPFSPQKPVKPKQNKENIPFSFQQQRKPQHTLNSILQSYRKSFSLLCTLDIDESEYRALFFSARDDKYKGTNYLENEMKYRNRFIKEEMARYSLQYDGFKERAERQRQMMAKKKSKRLKRMMSLNERSPNQQIPKVIDQTQQQSISPRFQLSKNKASSSPPCVSNLLTSTYNFSKVPRQQKVHSNLYSYNRESPNRNQEKQKQNPHQYYANCNNTTIYDRVRQDEFQDFINQIKVKGQFRMTKVLFGRDGKLELSPFNQSKQTNQPNSRVQNSIKNKIIFRKAQQNIRKKLTRIPTEPPSTTNSSKRSYHQTNPQSNPLTNALANPFSHQRQSLKTQLPQTPSFSPAFYYQTEELKNKITTANKTQYNKKPNKCQWKEKQIKFMGIKGINQAHVAGLNSTSNQSVSNSNYNSTNNNWVQGDQIKEKKPKFSQSIANNMNPIMMRNDFGNSSFS